MECLEKTIPVNFKIERLREAIYKYCGKKASSFSSDWLAPNAAKIWTSWLQLFENSRSFSQYFLNFIRSLLWHVSEMKPNILESCFFLFASEIPSTLEDISSLGKNSNVQMFCIMSYPYALKTSSKPLRSFYRRQSINNWCVWRLVVFGPQSSFYLFCQILTLIQNDSIRGGRL